MLPLAARVVVSLFSGNGPGGRGAIRVWLGTLAIVCASSAIEAMLRWQGQDDTATQTGVIGHALAQHLTLATGKPAGVLILGATGLVGLIWMFGRRAPQSDSNTDTVSLPLQPSVPRRARLPVPAPGVGASEPSDNRPGVATAPRKRDPWPLPGELLNPASPVSPRKRPDAWLLQNKTTETLRPARPASEWAPFEALRPTKAMLARSGVAAAPPVTPIPAHVITPKPALAGSILSKPGKAPVAGRSPGVRISTASDRSQAIPTALSTALRERHPEPLPTMATQVVTASTAMRPVVPAVVGNEAVIASEPFKIVETGEAPLISAAVALPASVASVSPVVTVAHAPASAATSDDVQTAVPAPTPRMVTTPLPACAPVHVAHAQSDAVAGQSVRPRPGTIPLPGIDLLDQGSDAPVELDEAQLAEIGQLIEQRLKEFKVPVTVLGAYAGPVITRFEIEPALGVRGAQIVNLMKDLARALGLTSIRVVETIPGKTCMGLELPNPRRQMIRLAEMICSDAYARCASCLTLAMGKDITGVPVATDLARAPHMLVAGTTGSGKSVAINAMILSLLYKATPDDVRLIMIDPKMLELSVYDGIPHLLAPVVTDMKLADHALSWCVAEMDKRYRLMSSLGVRNLAGFNQKIADGIAAEQRVKNPFSLTPDMPEPLEPLPMIVVVIDELADLMMVAGKKIEELIARLAQKARAAGIHLILATQRPSVDVITGLIKANIPTRVAFQVSSKIDSRTVLDQMGAETLLGHGDMLFLPPGSGYPQRVHGAFVSDEEVHRVVEHLKAHGEPQYEEAILAGPASEEPQQGDMFGDAGDEADPLYDEAVAYVTRSRRASISSVQRQFRIGYNRAARLVEQMEAAGVLSTMSRSGSRDVLAPPPPD